MFNSNKKYTKLINSCKKGNRKAQFELYEQHKVFLFEICLRYAKTRTEAEDILQEGFYKILKDLKQIKNIAAIKGWMRQVMVNTALMHLRKHQKIKFDALSEYDIEELNQIEIMSENKDKAQAAIRMIQYLPSGYQAVFNLRAIEGYSFKEISKQLNIKETTLRSHYHRAKEQLKQILEKEFENGQS